MKKKFVNLVKHPWFLVSTILIVSIVSSFFIPWNINVLSSHPHSVQSYDEAVQRIDTLDEGRASLMNPGCLTQFMTHGQKVQKVIVFVHGYTNCPIEFVGLGKEFYDLGYNVLIVPMPHHGLIDRTNTEQGQLSADELATYGDKIVDIAQGLGDQVTVMGISCGGVVTAWAAQNRKDVDTAVVISPAFGYMAIPTLLTAPVMNAVITLPDVFVWWDAEAKERDGNYYTYPKYSKHALAQIMRLGFSVQVDADQTPPSAGRIFVITNANDDSVNNELTAKVAESWRQQGAKLVTYEFPMDLALPHDLIDANKPHANTELVYQKLIDLVTH